MKLSDVLGRPHANESRTGREHIPWITTPLEKQSSHIKSPEESTSNTGVHVVQLENPAIDPSHHGEYPVFKKHHESSTIELFYDLFFVANLTTFTSDHEIANTKVLASYVGFFSLLWFTWLQTTLFDVRFSSDSVFSRVGKCISFGVMIGFSVVGSQYDTQFVADNTKAFRAMSLVLMVSRVTLVVQYGVVCWYVRGYKKALLPLVWTIAILSLTAAAFLGLFFAFEDDSPSFAYIGWYVLIVFEALAITAVTCYWRSISFRQTYLVERVGLLTLIIMGEGIIGISKSVASIMQNAYETSISDIGVIVAAVLLIYFIWILYFDQIEHDRFGTIRQQVWTLLHFPLHVAVLLTVEGSTQFILWNTVQENFAYATEKLQSHISSVTPGNVLVFNSSAEYIASLKDILVDIDLRFKEHSLPDFSSNFTAIQSLKITSEEDRLKILEIILDMVFKIYIFIFNNFNVDIPESDVENTGSEIQHDADVLAGFLDFFVTVMLFFYVAAGVFLIILGIMYWFGKNHKSKKELVSVFVRFVAGIGIALLSLLGFNDNAFRNLIESAWIIPIVVIVYAIVIVLDNLLTWHTAKVAKHHTRRHQLYSSSPTKPTAHDRTTPS